ncbi:MAG: hypothetical protein K0U41_08705 [Gammaproteobacteria bacterium]|nr:hypothetical protein [Gammaproteobacteria bacterium]
MVDLSDNATESHWRDLSSTLYALLTQMESKESWTCDEEPAIRDALEEWAANYSGSMGSQAKSQTDNFLRFLSFIRSKRSMLILQELEKAAPGSTSDLLFECLKVDEGNNDDRRHQQIFRDRLIAISQVGALNRMFSEERLELVSKVIKETAKYHGAVYENV